MSVQIVIPYPSRILHKSAGRRREIYQSSVGERQVTAGFIAILRWSTGLPAVTVGSPDDRRRDTTGTSAEILVIWG